MGASADDNLKDVYQQLRESYRAIDDNRLKLLSLLPLATGAGILVLSDRGKTAPTAGVSAAVGFFGFVVTLGLFCYELHGIKKCAALIDAGKFIERQLHVYGQFSRRPQQVAGLIDEPFSASIIYPASLAGWTFFALLGAPRWSAFVVASTVFLLAAIAALWLIRCMEYDLRDSVREPYCKEPLWRRSRYSRGCRGDPTIEPLPDDAFIPDSLQSRNDASEESPKR